MRRAAPFLAVFVIGVAIAAGCVAASVVDPNDRLCTPGNYVFCRCQNRSEGTKLCKSDGLSFETCSDCSVDESIDAEAPPQPPEPTPPGRDAAPDDAPSTPPVDASPVDASPPIDAPAGPCTGKVDGFNWMPPDPNQRCCGGQPITTTSDTNCGACGIACNATNGEACGVLGGRYFCLGCLDSTGCWSQCCSTSFAPNGACAASNCVDAGCDGTHCPIGTHCTVGAPNSSDYCSY